LDSKITSSWVSYKKLNISLTDFAIYSLVCLLDEVPQLHSNDIAPAIMHDEAPLPKKLNKDENGTPSKSSLSEEKEEEIATGFSKDILMVSTVMALVLGILLGVLLMLVKEVCRKQQAGIQSANFSNINQTSWS